MEKRNIIVIGASAGGFEALQQLVANLPADLDAAIFIVWHMAPSVRGVLPDVLNRLESIHAANAIDMEPLQMNRIYVAPPDFHMVLEKDRVRITRGPKENRFRPAVDPLFRSAAYVYGSRVIGIVLSGALDDGTAGLWAIKERGGLAVVQDPADAAVPSMPQNAINEVGIDYQTPILEMGHLLTKLCKEPLINSLEMESKDNEKTKVEIGIALQENASSAGVMPFGKLVPYSCPECHGVLTALTEGNRVRFRCHTGHAYSADSLISAITEKIEDGLWSAIRSIKESVMLLNHMGDHFAENNQPKLAAMYFIKAKEADKRELLVRNAVLNHEMLNTEIVQEQTEDVNT